MCLEYLRSSEGFSASIRLCISNQWLLRSTKHQRSNVVYAVKCSEKCEDLYIGATKQSLYRRMAQHRRANSSGQDSAVFLHLQQKKHNFHDHEVRILDREERWFERGVKEVIHVKVEHPSLNRGEGLRHLLSHANDAVLETVPRRCKERSGCSVRRVGGAPSWAVTPSTLACVTHLI